MIDNKIIDATGTVARFRYAGTSGTLAWLSAFILLIVFFMVEAYMQGDFILILVFIVPSLLFFVGLAFLGVYVCADVHISPISTSRYFGGRMLQQIKWDNISEVKIFDGYSRQQRKMQLVINVFPQKSSGMSWLARRKIVLSESPMSQGSFAELVALMNYYIAEHKITITSTIGGVISYPDRLCSELKNSVLRH